MKKLRVDVWSDIACPWCHVGKRHLEAALARFPHREQVDVVWRAFELDPSAPREHPQRPSYAARLASKYGTSTEQAEGMIATMTETARKDGLDFRFDRIRSGNTFDAHRVLHLARERAAQDAVKERFLLAYLGEGEPIGDPETLVRLAAEAGLDAAEVRATLASDAFAREVREDEAEAREIGIRGVPFFVLGGRYALEGAQPADLILQALQKAWEELPDRPALLGGDGLDAPADVAAEVCGLGGCQVPGV